MPDPYRAITAAIAEAKTVLATVTDPVTKRSELVHLYNRLRHADRAITTAMNIIEDTLGTPPKDSNQ